MKNISDKELLRQAIRVCKKIIKDNRHIGWRTTMEDCFERSLNEVSGILYRINGVSRYKEGGEEIKAEIKCRLEEIEIPLRKEIETLLTKSNATVTLRNINSNTATACIEEKLEGYEYVLIEQCYRVKIILTLPGKSRRKLTFHVRHSRIHEDAANIKRAVDLACELINLYGRDTTIR